MIALPLVGSIALTYAICNLIADLRRVESKRVIKRLKESDGLSNSANEQAAKESILRRQMHQSGGGLSRILRKFHFVNKLQRTLEKANLPWSATTVLMNVIAVSLSSR